MRKHRKIIKFSHDCIIDTHYLLLRYHIPQISIALHHVVGNGTIGDSGEVMAGIFYFHAFSIAVILHFSNTIAITKYTCLMSVPSMNTIAQSGL